MDTISIVPEVVEYFSSNGSDHDKMMSNYMMGRYYADKGDAPRALKYYRDAISFSDTTKADCDYKNLSRIYGQIATLFNTQRSPRLELNAERKAVYYARKANDTIASLIFFEHLSAPYHLMNMTDSAIYYCKAASDSFLKYGHEELAAGCRGFLIENCINNGKMDSAKIMIDEYENKSYAFDERGKIHKGLEFFYFLKGRYYEYNQKYDSAITLYKKLIDLSGDINHSESAYKGLMSVYHRLAKSDSVVKYAKLFADANDSSNIKHSADEINRLQAIYNYDESLYIANIEKAKAHRRLIIIYVIMGCALVLGVSLVIFFKYLRIRRRDQLITMSKQYSELLNKFAKARQDLSAYQEGYDKYRQKKESEIEELKQALSVFQEDNSRPEMWEIEDAMLNSKIVKSMHGIACQGKAITDVQWEDFENLISSKLCVFYNRINDSSLGLNDIEKKICMLIRLRFIPSELAVLLDLSKQRITNIRTTINMKLFKEKGTKSLDANIRKIK
ncbi:MAG: hypothetical protein IJ647_00835 [Prevotella sp.]|nr:hypothetical protein [Prevotella sp.]